MKEYAISVFDCNRYSDELIEVEPEEAEEVFRLIAEDRQCRLPDGEAVVSCYLCQQPIRSSQQVEHHHPIYKSRGGTTTAPTHKECHRQFHSRQGDFKEWGRIGGNLTALTRRWAFNLVNVRKHPAYALDRKFYLAHYAS